MVKRSSALRIESSHDWETTAKYEMVKKNRYLIIEMAFQLTSLFAATTVTGDNEGEVMVKTNTPPLSEDLRQKLDDIAREQNREPAEVLEEAVRRYIGVQALERLAQNGERYARARGIKEEDVPGLVKEVRRENRERGRSC